MRQNVAIDAFFGVTKMLRFRRFFMLIFYADLQARFFRTAGTKTSSAGLAPTVLMFVSSIFCLFVCH